MELVEAAALYHLLLTLLWLLSKWKTSADTEESSVRLVNTDSLQLWKVIDSCDDRYVTV